MLQSRNLRSGDASSCPGCVDRSAVRARWSNDEGVVGLKQFFVNVAGRSAIWWMRISGRADDVASRNAAPFCHHAARPSWRRVARGLTLWAGCALSAAGAAGEPIKPIPNEVGTDPVKVALGRLLFHDPGCRRTTPFPARAVTTSPRAATTTARCPLASATRPAPSTHRPSTTRRSTSSSSGTVAPTRCTSRSTAPSSRRSKWGACGPRSSPSCSRTSSTRRSSRRSTPTASTGGMPRTPSRSFCTH